MSKWKKVTAPENITTHQVGYAALDKFAAGEIFLINLDDQQTQKKLIDLSVYENESTKPSPINMSDSKPATNSALVSLVGRLWEKAPKTSYLLLATYSDDSRGIFYNNMPFSPIKLDKKKLSNCWGKTDNVSEAFCYNDDKTALKEFISLVDKSAPLGELAHEICGYFNLNAADFIESYAPPAPSSLKCG